MHFIVFSVHFSLSDVKIAQSLEIEIKTFNGWKISRTSTTVKQAMCMNACMNVYRRDEISTSSKLICYMLLTPHTESNQTL